jgi:hypothetical protein
LAAALPPGPTVLWACDRDLAITLAQDRARELLLLEPREAEASAGIRHGSSGLQVRHTPLAGSAPDLSDVGMTGFAAAVIDLRAPGDAAGEPGSTVRAVAELVAQEALVVVVAQPEGALLVVDALGALGWATVVIDGALATCSHIGPADAPPEVRFVGEPSGRVPQVRLVVAGREASALPRLVVIGSEQGRSTWQRGVDQLSATVTALDAVVDRARAERIASLEAEVAHCRSELADTRRSAAELAAALDAVHTSTSWRVTRPLRSLKDRTGRG